jgi:hypothetical protein
MTIVNFIFTQIQAERALAVEGKISIRNNVSIKDVSKQELDLGARKQPVLKFAFEFTSNYDPKIGSIKLGGELIYMDEDKKLDEIVKEWKKEKKIKKEISNEILNNILAKCNVEALIISKDINLPPPIPLPKLQEEIKP